MNRGYFVCDCTSYEVDLENAVFVVLVVYYEQDLCYFLKQLQELVDCPSVMVCVHWGKVAAAVEDDVENIAVAENAVAVVGDAAVAVVGDDAVAVVGVGDAAVAVDGATVAAVGGFVAVYDAIAAAVYVEVIAVAVEVVDVDTASAVAVEVYAVLDAVQLAAYFEVNKSDFSVMLSARRNSDDSR